MRKSRIYNVEGLDGERFSGALELLAEGHKFTFNDVDFHIVDDTTIQVSANDEHFDIDAKQATLDLNRALNTFSYIKENSNEFANMVEHLTPRFSVINDDGMAVFELCYLKDDKIAWLT